MRMEIVGARASEPAKAPIEEGASERPQDSSIANTSLESITSDIQFMEKGKYINISHHLLPHWHQEGKVQFVTFRLADSLPQSKLTELSTYKKEWIKQHPLPWDEQTKELYNHEVRDHVDKWLDQNYGSCILQREDIRQIVVNSLFFYHEKEYILWHFVVMPNHVHLLVSPIGDNNVVKSIGSVKRFTANAINKILVRKDSFWQPSVFDRLVRDNQNFTQYINYINNNPRNLPQGSYTLGTWASEPTKTSKKISSVGLGGPTS